MYQLIYLVVLFLTSCHSPATKPDDFIKEFMVQGKVPGVFVAVVKGDSVLYEKSFGLADVESKIPLTGNTCMELGSVSKAFTGEIIYSLHQQGLLNLEDPVRKFFPDAPLTWEKITIKHLLSHTSGIQNYLLDPRFKAGDLFLGNPDSSATTFFNTIATDSMVKMFYSLPVEFNPGTTWAYSNTGYYLLGKIVESITARPFFETVNQMISAPLNFSCTKANEIADQENCLSKGYFIRNDSLTRSRVLTSNYAFSAGAWSTCGDDMIRYIKAVHLHALPSDNAGYLWRNTNPYTELPFAYEGGRFFSMFKDLKIISHNGGTPGFSSSWFYIVEKNTSIIVLANRQDYAAVDQLAIDILSYYEPAIKFPGEKLNDANGKNIGDNLVKVFNAIKNNEPYPPVLSMPLRVFLETDNGRGLWKWFFERGFPSEAICVDKEGRGIFKAYRYRMPVSKNLEYKLTALVNDKNEIVQIRWW